MQAPRYQHIVQKPHLLRGMDIAMLESWVETYPHVPLFRAFLAAKGMQEGDSRVAKWLETAAIHASDRRQLKRLIQQWGNASQPSVRIVGDEVDNLEKPPVVEEARLETDHDRKEINPFEEAETPVVREMAEAPTTDPHPQNPVIDDIPEHEEVNLEVEDGQQSTSQDKAAELESDALEDGVIAPMVEVADAKESAVMNETADEKQQPSFMLNGHWSNDDITFLKAIGKWDDDNLTLEIPTSEEDWILEAPGKKIHALKPSDILDQGLVQTDIRWLAPWLEDFQFTHTPSMPVQNHPVKSGETVVPIIQGIPNSIEPVAQSQEPLKIESPVEHGATPSGTLSSTHSFEEWLTILAQKQKTDTPDAPIFDLPHANVVKGISDANPQEIDINVSFDDKTELAVGEEDVKKMAEESVSVRDEMATETLARIYVKQGKISHAIKVYQMLIQKYPKKSSYFTVQIQQLKAE